MAYRIVTQDYSQVTVMCTAVYYPTVLKFNEFAAAATAEVVVMIMVIISDFNLWNFDMYGIEVQEFVRV